MNISNIKDNTIIICENDYKKHLLKEMNNNHLFLNVKFYTKNEFIKNYMFNYNEKTIYYLVNKYNYKIDIIKMFLNNLYVLENKKYNNNNKINFLVNLKKELDDNNLLIYNDEFKEYIKNYNILVMGYDYIEKNELDIFNKINALIISDNSNNSNNYVYEFKNMEEEINFVCKKICELLDKGVDINKIKLTNVTKEYYNDINRIFSLYNIPIFFEDISLYSNIITQKFLKNYGNNQKDNIKVIENDNREVVNKIINICNKYSFSKDALKVKEQIIYDLKNTKINNKLKNYIEITSLFNTFNDNYVFLLNFNVGSIPKTFKDEEYITDDIKEELNLYKIKEKNKIYKENTINKIKSINNIVITYKLNNLNNEYYPSTLIKDMNLIIKKDNNNILNSYSLVYDKINYAKILDNYYKYNIIDNDYYIYNNSIDIEYNVYDNKFKGINNNTLKEYLNNKLILSYSSLNNFNKCSFRYYLTNILKLDNYEESFETFIGSLFHNVLEKCFNNNLDVKEEINNYIKEKNKVLSIKEEYFINKITKDIEYVINVLNKQKEITNLDKYLYEKNIVIDKSNDMTINFTGYIDKILYKEYNDYTLVSIIDYKTGTIDIDLKYLPYGLSLQLPIYLYLVKKSNLFKNPIFSGFYLQYILDKDIKRDIYKDYDIERYNNLKLMGYSNCNIHYLKEFDNTYKDSSLIKGLKIKGNDEFYSYSKILTDEEIDKIIDLTEKNINDAIDKIVKGEFNINPKKIGYDKNIGCEYCKFKDICNRKEEDYKILKEINNLDFLKGEEYAKMD